MAEVNQPLGTNYLLVVESAEMDGEPRGMAVYRITLRPEAREEDFEAEMESILRTLGDWSGHIGERITQQLIKEDASAPGLEALGCFESDMYRLEPLISSMSGSTFREVLSFS